MVKKILSNNSILVYPLFILLLIINDFYRFPILDDLYFNAEISRLNPFGFALKNGFETEGRFLSPVMIGYFFLVYFLNWSHFITLFVLQFSSLGLIYLAVRKNKEFGTVVSILLITFLVLVRHPAHQTFFWQTGFSYFLQLALLIYYVLVFFLRDEKYNLKRYIWILILGSCTYHVGIFVFILESILILQQLPSGIKNINFKTLGNVFHHNKVRLFMLFIVVLEVLFMLAIGDNQRMGLVELNSSWSSLMNAFFISMFKWIFHWWPMFIAAAFFGFVTKPSVFSHEQQKPLKQFWLFSGIFLASFASILPTLFIKNYYEVRVSIFWGFGFSLCIYFISKVIRCALDNWLDRVIPFFKQVESAYFVILFNLLLLISFAFQTQEVKGFSKVYFQRENDLYNHKDAVSVIGYKTYRQRELYSFFGYSDEHMLGRAWMKSLYTRKYGISEIRLVKDSLIVDYKDSEVNLNKRIH